MGKGLSKKEKNVDNIKKHILQGRNNKMIKFNKLFDNPNMKVIAEKGPIKIFEHEKDMSTNISSAEALYYASKMNVRKRQAFLELNNSGFVVSAGAMQWTAGDVKMVSNVKGVGDLVGKMFAGKATGESTIKPKYIGTGCMMLEPTYKYLLLENPAEWGGAMVIDDGMFLACEDTVEHKIVARSNISSAVLGGEGLFNLSLEGNGVVLLESKVAKEELIEVILENDEIRIDGNFAVAWSKTLNFTVEKSSKSLIASGVSGEGFVNVYRGTGKILMAPVQ